MVLFKEIESMCRVTTDNKIIHAPKRQSMKRSKMRCVYKRDSIMLYFPGGKENASKILSDKVYLCNKYQLERINNRAEGCFLCMKCGDCEFCFFQQLIIEICQVGEYVNIHIKE